MGYGPDSSYTKQDLDRRNSEYKRGKQQELEERIAQRAAQIVIEKMQEQENAMKNYRMFHVFAGCRSSFNLLAKNDEEAIILAAKMEKNRLHIHVDESNIGIWWSKLEEEK